MRPFYLASAALSLLYKSATVGREWYQFTLIHGMTAGRKSLFIFLMGLAWKCRYSMPLLLSGTVAALGHAWMFQIRVHTVHRLHENELAYYDEEDEIEDDDDTTWETGSTGSWETIVEEVAYG